MLVPALRLDGARGWSPIAHPARGSFSAGHPHLAGLDIAPYEPPAPTAADVHAEMQARIAAGFTYDFGGGIGVRTLDCRNDHDEKNWLGGLALCQTLIGAGQGAAPVGVRDAANQNFETTAAGLAAALTAMLLWRKSYLDAAWALKDAGGGIPADYTDNGYWP